MQWREDPFTEYAWAQPWLWPRRIAVEPRWNQRLGRVAHWCLALFAIGAFGTGTLIQLDQRSQRADEVKAAKAWDADHTVRVPALVPKGTPFVPDTTPSPTFAQTERPYVREGDWWPLAIGAMVAFASLLVGRGLRYIFGGE